VSGSWDRRRWAGGSVAFGLVLLLLVSGYQFAVPRAAPPVGGATSSGIAPASVVAPVGGTVDAINSTLTVNRSSVNLSNAFWGVTVNNEVHLLRGETNAVNATPSRVLVWPGAMAGEDYDPFTETHYATDTGTPTPALTTEAQFVRMCKAIDCIAIVQVPAEIDDPAFAEQVVNYTEINLSFHPAYWMIGNEPELWSHWKVPWKDWPSDYTNGPTPTQFGDEVVQYVDAIRQVDNTTPILGLPASGCTCGSWTFAQWIAGVLKVTGPKIQAVAFHEYPAGWLGTGDGSLLDFYSTLQSSANIPIRIAAARAAVESTCPDCNVSVFISELGAALSWSAYGQYADGFSGALSIASQITQGMDDNVTNVDLFAAELATTNSWFAPNGYARPDYGLYTEVLDHLGTEASPVNLSGMDHTLYAIDTVAPNDQGRQDLLVMNDNITHAVAFTPAFAGEASNAPVEVWSWNGSIHTTHGNDTTWVEPFTPTPIASEYPQGLPTVYTLPPQSLVLFEAYPGGASYVQVREHGVPASVPWFTNVGGRFYTTTASNLSLLLPTGSYPISSVGIPLPIGGREFNPGEQLGPMVSSPLEVAGASANSSVQFVDQWRVNVTASPGPGGNVTPEAAWWNVSEPLTLTATPSTGYAFAGWSGWGPGSTNSSARSITLLPGGPLMEKARFVVGQEVDLEEFGLPIGTPWSVNVRNFTTTSRTDLITVYEPNGTFGFTVAPIPGYRAAPANGSFSVAGPVTFGQVRFIAITPAPDLFPVQFQVTGLPGSTPVWISIRNAAPLTSRPAPVFSLPDGTYAYQVGYVAGYHAQVPLKIFSVHGGPVTVVVPFAPTVYPVHWEASGARIAMSWSVNLDGRSFPASSAWVDAALANGTYAYTIDAPANFSVTPTSGVVTVRGFGVPVNVLFNPAEFPTWFEATGPGASTGWSVRLGNLTRGATSARSAIVAANGTYTFDVHPPAGFYAVPSHGRITVAGLAAPVQIRFYPSTDRPSAALVDALNLTALSIAVWIGASSLVGFALVRWLRGRSDPDR
jgi:hypothetical protein